MVTGITGTFLDEISHDIPSANWGKKEWRQDFQAMKDAGIDTVILIRAGYKNIATFPSQVLARAYDNFIGQEDLIKLFLTLSDEYDIKFYLGTYDSGTRIPGKKWPKEECKREVELNIDLVKEICTRYGHYKAFKGWYLSFEISDYDEEIILLYKKLFRYLKRSRDIPILMSPYANASKQVENPEEVVSFEKHKENFEKVFHQIHKLVDIVAFQDGQMHYDELPAYLEFHRNLARRYDLECWSNVETFDRDTPIKFPPIAWSKLRFKLEAAQEKVDKLITFEFSHFLSPNSIYPSAHNLNRRYLEWLE
jgi:hypothetical protein